MTKHLHSSYNLKTIVLHFPLTYIPFYQPPYYLLDVVHSRITMVLRHAAWRTAAILVDSHAAVWRVTGLLQRATTFQYKHENGTAAVTVCAVGSANSMRA